MCHIWSKHLLVTDEYGDSYMGKRLVVFFLELIAFCALCLDNTEYRD